MSSPRAPGIAAGSGFRFVWLILLFGSLAPAGAMAQEPGREGPARIAVESAPRPTAAALRTDAPPTVDGRLDEPVWQQAQPLTGFVQSRPDTGAPATENTVVYFAYDDRALYIGAICHDSEPDRYFISSLKQDFNSGSSDVFGVALDTYLDRRNGFMFLVNPGGALKDVQLFDDSRSENQAWEGPIRVETTRHDEGWTVEIEIPFSTLRFNPSEEDQTWGLQILRRIRRKAEDTFWAPLDRRDQIHKMSKAGTLTGFRGVGPGLNLRVKPYALAQDQTGTLIEEGRGGSQADIGFDVKYGVTPGLALDLTYNTDFAQVEVDQEQVNLTRFPLFFPEKRDFFVENSGTFAFGDQSERSYRTGVSLRDLTLFHSRRIGLTGRGEPIPILGGARLTGRTGGFEVGLMNLQTRSGRGLPAENFSVMRARRSVFGTSDVGAIFINREATGSDIGGHPDFNRNVGFDANLRPLPSLLLAPFLAWTDSPDADGNALAGRMWVGWRDELWDVSALWRHVGEDFNPTVGFVRRRDIRQSYATVGLHPRPPVPGVQEVNPYIEIDYIQDLESVLVTRRRTAGFGVSFLNGSGLTLDYTDRFELLRQPFRVSSDGTVPIGRYNFGSGSVQYRSAPGRALTGFVRVERGGFFDGTLTSLSGGLMWRPSHHLSVDLSANHNDISLPDGAFTADVFGGRVDYGLSTKVFASAFVQYNAAEDQFVTNVRFNYLYSPLSDIFLVYTERRDLAAGMTVERVLAAKVSRSIGF
ncbi:MAG: carbohydrate binding family 9 domain-containing protein [Gemmatimonadales bacterium]|nr:carbohydrate binding family 9 domain-containing protein [Gemmatimonadales bacterium]MYL07042.1 carbohydrate binding family 9 domain-containing protein [Gemmatimonadales bacterium]